MITIELFDVVDENDEIIGSATREEVHGNPSLIHRVVHVLVFNSSGELYLQLRCPDKDVMPNRWDTSVGGHVDAGEEYDAAAVRETREELSIRIDQLEPLYRYLHRNEHESEMIRTYRLIWDGPVSFDPGEITDGRFWTIGSIDASDPELFTPNFLDELRRFREWTAASTIG